MDDHQLTIDSINYVKSNKKLIVEKFASLDVYKPSDNPLASFMAGSPGAGKTEFSRIYVGEYERTMQELSEEYLRVVMIDADEIRKMLPGYNGKNSDLFVKATADGVSKLIDYCFDKKLNMLVDGTFSSPNSLKNIERAIKHKRVPNIFYIYQDPIRAWELTKAREFKDGRFIPKSAFINSFVKSKLNIRTVKERWGKGVVVDFIERDFETNSYNFRINVDDIDSYISKIYNEESLNDLVS